MPIEIQKGNKTALVWGTGNAVGDSLLELLLFHSAYRSVHVLSSQALELEHPKLRVFLLKELEKDSLKAFYKGDDLFLCSSLSLVQSGTKEEHAFLKRLLELASQKGVNQVLMVSARGASDEALLPSLQKKADLEELVKSLSFWGTHIFQPGPILPERPGNRWGEQLAGRIGSALNRLTGGMVERYRPVEADIVAKAMVSAAQKLEQGTFVYPADYLQKLARELDEDVR
jgi:hypothetical protein